MKTKEFVALEKRLLSRVPGFATKGSIFFIAPVEHTLRGFSFEGSSFDRASFYVWRFFLPLCVPRKHLGFNLGDRLKNQGSGGWSVDASDLEAKLASAMQKEAAFLRTLRTPADVVRAIKSLVQNSRDPYGHEALAYMLARSGDIHSAIPTLDDLLNLLDAKISWQQQMALRAETLKVKLLSDPTEAAEQLLAWEIESIHNLGLQGFRAQNAPVERT